MLFAQASLISLTQTFVLHGLIGFRTLIQKNVDSEHQYSTYPYFSHEQKWIFSQLELIYGLNKPLR